MSIDDLRTYIRTELLADETIEIAPDQDLLLSEMLDSLSVTRLVAHIEETKGVVIPPEDVTLENFRSLEAMAGYLDGR